MYDPLALPSVEGINSAMCRWNGGRKKCAVTFVNRTSFLSIIQYRLGEPKFHLTWNLIRNEKRLETPQLAEVYNSHLGMARCCDALVKFTCGSRYSRERFPALAVGARDAPPRRHVQSLHYDTACCDFFLPVHDESIASQLLQVALSADFTCGFVSPVFLTSDMFDTPTTAMRKGNSLYVVQAKFGVPFEERAMTSYEIIRVDRDAGEFNCTAM